MKSIRKLLFVALGILLVARQVHAEPLEVLIRTNDLAIEVPNYSFNGLYRDNANAMMSMPQFFNQRILFTATLKSGSSISPADLGLWAFDTASNERWLIHRAGDPAPGTETGTTFRAFPLRTMDQNGRVFFSSWFNMINQGAPEFEAIYEADWGSNSNLVLRRGTPAPTMPAGRYTTTWSLEATDPSIAGVDFISEISVNSYSGESPSVNNARAGLMKQNGSLNIPVYSWGAVEGVPTTWYSNMASFRLSASGLGVAAGEFWGAGVQTIVLENGHSITADAGVWSLNPSGRTLALMKGYQAPEMPQGVVIASIHPASIDQTRAPAINSAGTSAFLVTVDGPGVSSSDNFVLYKIENEVIQIVARSGMPAPALGPTAVVTNPSGSSSTGTLAVEDDGDILFLSNWAGPGMNLANLLTFWKKTPSGQLHLLAQSGVSYNSLPTGITISRTNFGTTVRRSLEDVYATATVVGTGVTTANNDVLLKFNEQNTPRIILREGDTIDGYILRSFSNSGADLQVSRSGYAIMPGYFVPASQPTSPQKNGILGIHPNGTVKLLTVVGAPAESTRGSTVTPRSFQLNPKGAISESGKVVFAADIATSTVRDEALLVAQITSGNACVADFDHDGALNSNDVTAFLSAWFARLPAADTDQNGTINTPDIFAFLSLYFAGC